MKPNSETLQTYESICYEDALEYEAVARYEDYVEEQERRFWEQYDNALAEKEEQEFFEDNYEGGL